MYAEERQQEIAQLILESGRFTVKELAERYGVSTETVRRDLAVLEHAGIARRTHGGVVAGGGIQRVIGSSAAGPETESSVVHGRLANAAIEFLPAAGSSVILDAGAESSHLGDALPRGHKLTVITRSVPVANQLTRNPDVELHLLPGRVRPSTLAAVSSDTVAALNGLRVDAAILVAEALSLDFGLSVGDFDEAEVQRAIAHSAQRLVVLCDASRLGTEALVRCADAVDVDVLITNARIDDDKRSAYIELGVDVVEV